uniref:Glycoprotein n=1 Tax=Rhabditophanes sp. KR3021 TaxID=114890 RepID=A0AC35UEB4_9BILA
MLSVTVLLCIIFKIVHSLNALYDCSIHSTRYNRPIPSVRVNCDIIASFPHTIQNTTFVAYNFTTNTCELSHHQAFITAKYVTNLVTNKLYTVGLRKDRPHCVFEEAKYIGNNLWYFPFGENVASMLSRIEMNKLFARRNDICRRRSFEIIKNEGYNSAINRVLRDYGNQDGTILHYEGNQRQYLYSINCTQYEATEIFRGRLVDYNCYKKVPVMIGNELRFTEDGIYIDKDDTLSDSCIYHSETSKSWPEYIIDSIHSFFGLSGKIKMILINVGITIVVFSLLIGTYVCYSNRKQVTHSLPTVNSEPKNNLL